MKEKLVDLLGKIILAVAIIIAAETLAGSFENLGDEINRGFSNLGGHISNSTTLLLDALHTLAGQTG